MQIDEARNAKELITAHFDLSGQTLRAGRSLLSQRVGES